MSEDREPLIQTDIFVAMRKEFRAFYATASATDAVLMDILLRMYVALSLAIGAPRTPGNPLADDLERLTDATERAYTVAREAVRASHTFRNLCPGDQARIEAVLFSPFPDWKL